MPINLIKKMWRMLMMEELKSSSNSRTHLRISFLSTSLKFVHNVAPKLSCSCMIRTNYKRLKRQVPSGSEPRVIRRNRRWGEASRREYLVKVCLQARYQIQSSRNNVQNVIMRLTNAFNYFRELAKLPPPLYSHVSHSLTAFIIKGYHQQGGFSWKKKKQLTIIIIINNMTERQILIASNVMPLPPPPMMMMKMLPL